MKLFHLILGRMSAALIVILTLWAGLFYLAVMEEVNDEVDDSLEDYSEALILRWLSGEELPARSNGSNNQYFLYEVSESYARMYPRISYHDEMVYITEKDEEEPARVLNTILRPKETALWSWSFIHLLSRKLICRELFWGGLSFFMYCCCWPLFC